jgi:hypothetical protein
MGLSNTGLDSVDLAISTLNPFLISTSPASYDSNESSRDATTTPAPSSTDDTISPNFAVRLKLSSLNTPTQTEATPPILTSDDNLHDDFSDPSLLPIARLSRVYVCKTQGCSVRFIQLRHLK